MTNSIDLNNYMEQLVFNLFSELGIGMEDPISGSTVTLYDHYLYISRDIDVIYNNQKYIVPRNPDDYMYNYYICSGNDNVGNNIYFSFNDSGEAVFTCTPDTPDEGAICIGSLQEAEIQSGRTEGDIELGLVFNDNVFMSQADIDILERIDAISNTVGELSSLDTLDKSSIVSAINENLGNHIQHEIELRNIDEILDTKTDKINCLLIDESEKDSFLKIDIDDSTGTSIAWEIQGIDVIINDKLYTNSMGDALSFDISPSASPMEIYLAVNYDSSGTEKYLTLYEDIPDSNAEAYVHLGTASWGWDNENLVATTFTFTWDENIKFLSNSKDNPVINLIDKTDYLQSSHEWKLIGGAQLTQDDIDAGATAITLDLGAPVTEWYEETIIRIIIPYNATNTANGHLKVMFGDTIEHSIGSLSEHTCAVYICQSPSYGAIPYKYSTIITLHSQWINKRLSHTILTQQAYASKAYPYTVWGADGNFQGIENKRYLSLCSNNENAFKLPAETQIRLYGRL